jgi:hypothetical protein
LDQLVRALAAAGEKIVVNATTAKGKKGQKASRRKPTLLVEVATSNS